MHDRAQFQENMRREMARAQQQKRSSNHGAHSLFFVTLGMILAVLVCFLAGPLWGLIFASMVMARVLKRP